MTEIAVGTGAAEDLPEYPAPGSSACPFAPPPGLLALRDADEPVMRIRTWDGSTPWLVLSQRSTAVRVPESEREREQTYV
ncbi:hypothetical protein [Streptomyces sp. NPDC097610]|uniref:hypothetical protein n=1 Tax=Streptomyces sp. NPDC097610 TaxID=3157227 RepID=UPI003332A796